MARQAQEYVVGDLSDFPVGSHRVVQVGQREIGIFNIDGALYALPNLCPHQLGPLCAGKVTGTLVASRETDWKRQWVHEGEIVSCPWHALEYDIRSGQCLAYPAIRLRSYRVWVAGDAVLLEA